jgi:diguanylate cyclase (GGDEF)-like protein
MPVSARARLLAVGAVLVTAILIAARLFSQMERAEEIESYRKATLNLADRMASQTAPMLAAIDRTLGEMMGKPGLRQTMTEAQERAALRRKPMLDFMVQQQKALPSVSALAVYDNLGVLAAATRAVPMLPANLPLEAALFFRNSLEHGLFVSAPSAAAGGKWSILLGHRIAGPRGTYSGAVVAEVPLAYLKRDYTNAMPARGSVALIRRDGIMLLHYPGQDSELGRKIPGAAWYALAAGGGGGADTTDYFNNIQVIAAIRPIPGTPLVIEASVGLADALSGWRRQRVALIVGSFYASLCVILLLCLLDGQLRKLAASRQALAGNLSALQIANVHLDGARRQLDVVFSNISQGLCLFSANHKLIVCNRRYREIYQLPPGAGEPGVTLEEIVNHSYAAGAIANFARTDLLASFLSTARSGVPRQSQLDMADGRTIAIRQQPMPDGGWVATHEDITERRQAEAKVAYLARHDVLTGLANRALFMERIEQAIASAARGSAFAILFLDLDRFKAVNDTLGHQAGDALLRTVAARLLASVREVDTVARLGGDEFIVLQAGLESPGDAAQLAQRLIDIIGEPYILGEDKAEIGVSIGVELSDQEPHNADILIKNADLALYIAKSEGRGVFRFFEPEMDANAQNRYALERDLRLALERDEFEMYYQPIVDLRSGRICTFEALLRWNHPVRGLVQPGDFISAAEESGLIVPIGKWVLRQVCRQAAGWPEHISAAVNLSPIQFRAISLLGVVTDALAEAGLPARRLELEITESVLLASTETTYTVLHGLRALGICIAMDDFGIGYSSLSYLRRFPFDKIKIDQSFVADLTRRNDALFIVRAITGLCQNMGIRTTAEGVETAEQLEILKQEGCTEAQGYYFGEPKPAHAILLPITSLIGV